MWFQLIYLYCAIGTPTCTLTSAKVIETAPAYLTETECRRQQSGIPREATVENDPRSGYATVTCASREEIRREVQKSEAGLMKRMTPPVETPTQATGPVAG